MSSSYVRVFMGKEFCNRQLNSLKTKLNKTASAKSALSTCDPLKEE